MKSDAIAKHIRKRKGKPNKVRCTLCGRNMKLKPPCISCAIGRGIFDDKGKP